MSLGWDVSGTVVETGFGVTLFRPGDEVSCMQPFPRAPVPARST
ncbi:alcohol dehydrogenase catalytic domain-containing protein [Lentzea sp.]|nr:hypothetical protein [Lentzea sp.]HUQ56720.1 hypothetical protein [Lentzea sp.]